MSRTERCHCSIPLRKARAVNDKCGVVPCASDLPDLKRPKHTVLAGQRAYFVGHPVAVVVASDPYAARDALDLIEVEGGLAAGLMQERLQRRGPVLGDPPLLARGDAEDIVGAPVVVQRVASEELEDRVREWARQLR